MGIMGVARGPRPSGTTSAMDGSARPDGQAATSAPATYTQAHLRSAVEAAIRAPSLHNTQPWRFRLRDGGIEVRVDSDRRLPASDPTGWAARLSCGAAVFNLRVALAVAGIPAEVRIRPYVADPDMVARLVPGPSRPATPVEQDLHKAIPRRSSNRVPFWPSPVPPDVRRRLIEAARAENAWLELVIGSSAVQAIAKIVRASHTVLERDDGYRTELARWTRTGPADDGVPTEAAGPVGEPHDLFPQRPFGARTRAPGRNFEPEPLVAVLGTVGDSPADEITAGQALQRILLTVTDARLAASMISQPIEVPRAREQLRLALGRHGTPQMLIRIGYGQPSRPTRRRPVDEVID